MFGRDSRDVKAFSLRTVLIALTHSFLYVSCQRLAYSQFCHSIPNSLVLYPKKTKVTIYLYINRVGIVEKIE